MLDATYGLTKILPGIGYEDAIDKTRKALADEGFGVLTEIDVKATLKNKLDVDFPNYIILGACNPPLAYRALSADPGVGLLLPCNVVVTEDVDGNAVVGAIDPIAMFAVIGREDIAAIAMEVSQKLERVLAAL